MDLHSVGQSVLSFFETPLGAFVGLVIVDDVVGVVKAFLSKTFSPYQLPSFLESQFGTKQAMVVGGLGVMAAITAVSASLAKSSGIDLVPVAQAAFVAMQVGAAASAFAVLNDIKKKILG